MFLLCFSTIASRFLSVFLHLSVALDLERQSLIRINEMKAAQFLQALSIGSVYTDFYLCCEYKEEGRDRSKRKSSQPYDNSLWWEIHSQSSINTSRVWREQWGNPYSDVTFSRLLTHIQSIHTYKHTVQSTDDNYKYCTMCSSLKRNLNRIRRVVRTYSIRFTSVICYHSLA